MFDLPGVNVYDWGLDKKIKHSRVLRKLDKGSKSWYKVSPSTFDSILPAKKGSISPYFIQFGGRSCNPRNPMPACPVINIAAGY